MNEAPNQEKDMNSFRHSAGAEMSPGAICEALAAGTMSRPMARQKSCLGEWAAEDQAMAAAGMPLDEFVDWLTRAEDAWDDSGDPADWLVLCDWAEEHSALAGLVARTREFFALARD